MSHMRENLVGHHSKIIVNVSKNTENVGGRMHSSATRCCGNNLGVCAISAINIQIRGYVSYFSYLNGKWCYVEYQNTSGDVKTIF